MYGTRLHVLIPLSRQARADPDLPVRAGALFRSIELVSRATLRLRKVGRWRGMGSGTGWSRDESEEKTNEVRSFVEHYLTSFDYIQWFDLMKFSWAKLKRNSEASSLVQTRLASKVRWKWWDSSHRWQGVTWHRLGVWRRQHNTTWVCCNVAWLGLVSEMDANVAIKGLILCLLWRLNKSLVLFGSIYDVLGFLIVSCISAGP